MRLTRFDDEMYYKAYTAKSKATKPNFNRRRKKYQETMQKQQNQYAILLYEIGAPMIAQKN